MGAWKGRLVRKIPSAHAGWLFMALGVIATGTGLLQTTISQPRGGSVPCPEGTVLVANFDVGGQRYTFDEATANEDVVQITSGSATGGAWTSTAPMADVIVEGTTLEVITSFTPPATSGYFSDAERPPVGSGGPVPSLANMQFCALIGTSMTPAEKTIGATITSTGEPPLKHQRPPGATTLTTPSMAPSTVAPRAVQPVQMASTTVLLNRVLSPSLPLMAQGAVLFAAMAAVWAVRRRPRAG